MIKSEYFRSCLKDDKALIQKWINSMFMIIVEEEPVPARYSAIISGTVNVYHNNEWTPLTDAKVGEPIFDVDVSLDMNQDDMKCIEGDIRTTYGIALMNKILLEYGMSNKMPYINGEVSMGDIEDTILPNLHDDVENLEDEEVGKFYVRDIEKLSQADLMVQEQAHIFVVSRSKKSLYPATGIKEEKAKKIKEMEKKYGDKLWSEDIHAVEFFEHMQKFDREYLADDPSLGIVLSNKIVNISRSRRNIAFGNEKNPFNPLTPSKMIMDTLGEELDLTEEKMPYFVNSSRAGSLFRGIDTQKSGSIAKSLVMATMGLKYVDGDCGSKRYRTLLVERGKRFNNRTFNIGGKDVLVVDGTTMDGKVALLRDPMYCNLVNRYCRTCSGENAYKNPTALVLQATKFGGDLVNGDMKKMHGVETKGILIEF